MNKLEQQFLKGEPTELTESSHEVMKLRKALETNCLIGEWDVGGRVFWDDRRSVAVCAPPILTTG